MDASLTQKSRVALVTGAGQGIGRGIASVLAQKGYRLALTYHSSVDGIETFAQDMRHTYGAQPIVLQCDLTKPEDAQRIVAETVEACGRLDLVVNNAGGGDNRPLLDMSAEAIASVIHLDYTGPMLVAKHAAAAMIEQEIAGSILFITSSRGERAYPGDSIYGGMKAALIRSCGSLALEWAPHGIRVNCVGPGATVHNLDQDAYAEPLGRKIPLGRMGTPSDIGEAIAWLASPQASYITGINLRVDGGLILPGMPEDTSEAAGYGWGQVYEPKPEQ
ncbi:SDR family oxidoreductase [Paenibacillus sp. 598K]|uniref:SDR family NAD(P)-dependent oxidoreductase n=1 Tax=Paenibacillus sp. 598K TaxID=1117987 RepID=UPI000FF97A73|nr:SDR family oxidoreductase [Paenibacillus sp. 598K]GBF77615.1 SDR family oxidoreductase [Paenibacillus sp. 598K]